MHSDQLASLAKACGAKDFSLPPMRAVRGVSFTWDQLAQFAQRCGGLAPSDLVNEARILASDMPGTVVEKLQAAFMNAVNMPGTMVETPQSAAAEQDGLRADVLNLLAMLEAGEYAEHWAKSELGKRLENAVTELHNDIHEAADEGEPPAGAGEDADTARLDFIQQGECTVERLLVDAPDGMTEEFVFRVDSMRAATHRDIRIAIDAARRVAKQATPGSTAPPDEKPVEDVTQEMIKAGMKAGREYYERTGGNSPEAIYLAMRAVAVRASAEARAISND